MLQARSLVRLSLAAAVTALIGGWMAQEALKVLSGETPATAGAMRTFDGWTGRDRLVPVGQGPDCPACGKRRA